MDDPRLPPGPACHRGARVTLRFDGRAIEAFEGETVGAALHAAGERVLMRSIKYHRPRGLFCNTGKCASCLVRVDGTPNVRACVTPVRDGMSVRSQNAMPTARRDLYAVVDKVYRENFDYHERFLGPRFLVPLYHRVIRRMAGFGKVPDLARAPPARPAMARRDVDVLVVGAGPAGLAAGASAAEGAASVLVVDEGDRPGGSLLLHRDVAGEDGADVATRLAARVHAAGGELLAGSVAFGAYLTSGVGERLEPPGVVAVQTPERIVRVHAKALVVASGYHETPPLFPGNDLPGVMGARAALILLHRHGVRPGKRVVVHSADGLGRRAHDDLAKAGCDVTLARVAGASGGRRVERVVLEDGRAMEADVVVSAGDETPRIELLQQCGVPLAGRGFALVPREDAVPGVFAAGEVLGASDPASAMAHGARVGERAAAYARGHGR